MKYYFTSMTRISDLARRSFEVERLPRAAWERGDYVVGEVTRIAGLRQIELPSGRLIEVAEGDLLIGAFGDRFATLEATGSWTDIEPDGCMHLLTRGGLMGRRRSQSMTLPPLLTLHYRGHVTVDAKKATMTRYVARVEPRAFTMPVVLVIGTSMSSGKTTAARTIVRQLGRAGRRVVAAKLTGAGRYRDVLSMGDAGAHHTFDFVDVGLPSTIVPPEDYRIAIRQLLARMAGVEADVAVIELGASPLEPYNGTTAIDEIGSNVRFTVLCASDPYAVVGVQQAYGRTADLVAGIAANTEAGVQLVEALSGLPALNMLDKAAQPVLRKRLYESLDLHQPVAVG